MGFLGKKSFFRVGFFAFTSLCWKVLYVTAFSTTQVIMGRMFLKLKDFILSTIYIYSLLPKAEKLCCIACLSNAAVIRISESKLDNSIFNSEIKIDGYNILRFDRARHGEGIACYLRNYVSFMKRNYFPHDIETIFIEISLPKTKPMAVGIVYRPPSQTSLLENMNEHFYKLDTINKETYILGDFNINLYLNNKYVFEKCLNTVSNTIPYNVWKYQEFCNFF